MTAIPRRTALVTIASIAVVPSTALAGHPDREILMLFTKWCEARETVRGLHREIGRIEGLYPNCKRRPIPENLMNTLGVAPLRRAVKNLDVDDPGRRGRDDWLHACDVIDEREGLAEIEARYNGAEERLGELSDRIVLRYTPQTVSGLVAKLHVAFEAGAPANLDTSTNPRDWDWPHRALWMALKDAERLAGEGSS